MVKNIKNYELNSNVSIEDLKRAEFVKDNTNMKYSKIIYDDIGLHIAVTEDSNGTMLMNGITVMDEELKKPYTPFFDSENNFEYLDNVINGYNNVMDKLVDKGIFKQKTKKK